MRRFHSYGPVDCDEHFCVLRRALVEQCLAQLIDNPEKGGHYFTIWAPEQTGKTWLMQQVKQEITQRYGEQFAVFSFSLDALCRIEDTAAATQRNATFPQWLNDILQTALPRANAVRLSTFNARYTFPTLPLRKYMISINNIKLRAAKPLTLPSLMRFIMTRTVDPALSAGLVNC